LEGAVQEFNLRAIFACARVPIVDEGRMPNKPLGIAACLVALLVGCGRALEPAASVAVDAPDKTAAASPEKPIPQVSLTGDVYVASYDSYFCRGQSARLPAPGPFDDVPYDPAVFLTLERKQMAAKNIAEAPTVTSTQGRVQRKEELLIVSGARFVDRTREEHNDGSASYTYLGRLPKAAFDVVHGVHW
jgi:hypothetical protein